MAIASPCLLLPDSARPRAKVARPGATPDGPKAWHGRLVKAKPFAVRG